MIAYPFRTADRGTSVEIWHGSHGQFETRSPIYSFVPYTVKGERTIICGAQNHQPGDKVALILPNFALPLKPGEKEPFVIKERKVFGITSQGMMCSKKELGLGEDSDGIIILPPDAKVGQPFAEHLGRAGSDVVYDLEVTPNRPDLNSVIGIAREIAALTGNPLRLPVISNQCSVISNQSDGQGGAATNSKPITDYRSLVPRFSFAPHRAREFTSRESQSST